jgi:hypothetical protein
VVRSLIARHIETSETVMEAVDEQPA